MEVYIEVFAQNIPRNEQYKCNDAYYTFVAIDSRNRPIPVPTLEPETEAEKLKYEGALRRRQIRLVMAGKLDKDQATELKAYLNE
jgi:acyl-CoA hydrolase